LNLGFPMKIAQNAEVTRVARGAKGITMLAARPYVCNVCGRASVLPKVTLEASAVSQAW